MGNQGLKNYPRNWPQIARCVKEQAGWRCECQGKCRTDNHGRMRCPNLLGVQAAHLCKCWPPCGELSHLQAMCPRCHAGYNGRVLPVATIVDEPPPEVLEDLPLLDAWIFRHDYDVFSGVEFPYPMSGSHERLLKLLFPF